MVSLQFLLMLNRLLLSVCVFTPTELHHLMMVLLLVLSDGFKRIPKKPASSNEIAWLIYITSAPRGAFDFSEFALFELQGFRSLISSAPLNSK